VDATVQFHRSQVVEVASAIVAGGIRPLLGARMLIGHLRQLGRNVDPETVRFLEGVDSESDHLPLGEERKFWAETALKEKDQVAGFYELRVGPRIIDAAKKLLAQFSDP
jgi:hypothetical protein